MGEGCWEVGGLREEGGGDGVWGPGCRGGVGGVGQGVVRVEVCEVEWVGEVTVEEAGKERELGGGREEGGEDVQAWRGLVGCRKLGFREGHVDGQCGCVFGRWHCKTI